LKFDNLTIFAESKKFLSAKTAGAEAGDFC